MKRFKVSAVLFPFYSCMVFAQSGELYRAISQPVSVRIDDLMKRMTLEEKVGQLSMVVLEDVGGAAFDRLRKGEIGSFCITHRDTFFLDLRNRLQREAVEGSRLGIPVFFGFDVIHGYRTLFPTPLAISTSWNEDLAMLMAQVSAREARSDGIDLTFSPMVDVARDPRWGRISEGSGEDVLLNTRFGQACIKGYQGDSLCKSSMIAACLKHFAGYGAATGGRDYQYTELSERALREVYLPPFENGVRAGALAVMSAFNDISGVPATANSWLIQDILRKEWGFRGLVMSDWDSVVELAAHGISGSKQESATEALKGGVDMEMRSDCYQTLIDAVRKGIVSLDSVDRAVERILRMKFAMGLFDEPYKEAFACKLDRDAARFVAAESMVLLKNNLILPLKADGQSICLYGNWADSKDVCGWWNGNVDYRDVITVAEGLKREFGDKCTLIKDRAHYSQKSGIAIICVGERKELFGENHSRSSLGLPDNQLELIKELSENRIQTVVLVFSGRPLVLTEVEKYSDALLQVWHPGIETGNAIADILTGKVTPSGKLTTTFPRNEGQIPIFYSQRNSGRPMHNRYVDLDATPLYPFGYGLSYTTFKYSDFILSKPELVDTDTLEVRINVTNTGAVKGKEIVQLYISDKVSSVTQPQKCLIDFRKIELLPKETQTVCFRISTEQLKLWNRTMEYVLEKGEFELGVGGCSDKLTYKGFNVVSEGDEK